MELKELATAIEGVNRNLTQMREKHEDATKKFGDYEKENGEIKSQVAAMQKDLADAVSAVTEAKRAIALAAEAKRQHDDLTPEQKAQKEVFAKLVRYGEEKAARFTEAEQKMMSTLSNPDGGYNVPTDMSGRIMARVQLMSPVRQYASKQTISTGSLEGPIDNQELDDGWTGEVETRGETNTPQTGMWRIPVHERYAKPKVTQTLLDDSVVDIEAWLYRKIADRFARREAIAFLTGDGVNKPKGLLSQTMAYTADASRAWGTVQKVKTGANGAFAAAPNGGDCLIDLITELHTKYWGNALFFMNRYSLGALMKLKNSEGEYIWQPDFKMGPSGVLLGFKVDASFDHMPTIAADSLSIGFGNLEEAYQIVDRQGIRILRDPYSAKPFIELYATSRVGGDVLNSEAFKLLEFKA